MQEKYAQVFVRVIDICVNIFKLDRIANNMKTTNVTELFHFRIKTYPVFSVAHCSFFWKVRLIIGRSSPKIVIKLACESIKSNDPVKVMTPPEGGMERARSIIRVGETVSAIGKRDRGVEKSLDGAID